MAIVFPYNALTETNHDWNIVGNTKTAGISTGASVDVRSDGGGMWVASLNGIQFMDRYDTLLWRAIRQQCNGGVVPIVVPRRDLTWIPSPVGSTEYSPIPHSDGALFEDDTAYYQPVISVVTAGAAALRATSLLLALMRCADLMGGESFSINHPTFGWRMYEIGSVNKIDETYTSVTFNPPLREAVPAGNDVEFDRPRCTMKLINSAAMDLNATTYPFSLASVKFVEAKFA